MRKMHRWCGWAFGAVLLLQAITGLICTFRGELNALLYEQPGREAGNHVLPAGLVVERFTRDFPELAFERLFFPGSLMGDTAVVWARTSDRDLHIAVYDPRTANLLKAGPVTSFPAELVFFLHVQLLSGRPGQVLVGAFGVLLMIMSVTGYLRWRRTPGAPIGSAARMSPYARWLSRHRSLGIGLALIALLIAVTGGFLGLKVLATSAPRPPASAAERQLIHATRIDQAVRVARQTWPDGVPWSLTADPADPRRVTVIVRRANGLPPRATDQLTVDTDSGSTTEVSFAAQSFKSQASAWAHGLHSGEWLGFAAKPLMIVTGLGLGAMAVLGYALTVMRVSRLKRGPAR